MEPIQQRVFRHEIAEGLLYTHSRLNANTRKTLESASFLYALVELLSEKGLLAVEELDERKQARSRGGVVVSENSCVTVDCTVPSLHPEC